MQINGNSTQAQQNTVKPEIEASKTESTKKQEPKTETQLIKEALNDPETKKTLSPEFKKHFGAKFEKEGIAKQKEKTDVSLQKRVDKAAGKLSNDELQDAWKKSQKSPFSRITDEGPKLTRVEQSALKRNQSENHLGKLPIDTSPQDRAHIKEFNREINKSKNKSLGFPENTTREERAQYLKTLDQAFQLSKSAS